MSNEQNGQAIRPKTGGMMTINIADEIAQIKSSPEWESADRRALSVIKDPPLNIMLMVLKKGARLHEHSTKGPVVVQVLSGSIRFSAGAERVLCASEMVGLDRNITHSVEALEESAISITAAID